MREKGFVMPDEAASTLTADAPDQSAVSTMVAPDATPLSEAKQRALEKHFTPAQLAALQQTKADGEAPAAKATDKAKVDPAPADQTDPDEVVIDFSAAEETPAEGTSEEAATEPDLTEEELTGLNDKARKKLSDAHKEAAKVRKRAQEAERKAVELETRLKELDTASAQRGNDIPAELNAANSLSHVTDDAVLNAYEQDARNVLSILQAYASGKDVDTSYKSLVDGQTYDLDHTYAAWAAGTVLDVEGRRKQLTVLRKAQDTASKIETRLKETPGFTDALKGITGQKLITEWPQRRVQAAIGELVTSGQYRLIKISNGKAAGATSPAAVTAPTPKKAATSSPSTPQRELRGTMPAGAPAGGSAVSTARLSQLEQQAMKSGHPDDVKALMAAKMELRRANRQNS
jgi:hypothetical protein